MKLACIYNAWDALELLPHSVKSIEDVADEIIIVYSFKSNFGEDNEPQINQMIKGLAGHPKISFHNWEPDQHRHPFENEIAKRNHGLSIARYNENTHFLMMDCDEFYSDDLVDDCNYLEENDLLGLVSPVQCYFGRPDLTIGLDITLAPTIQKIVPNLKFLNTRNYPFSYKGDQPVIDPTRRTSLVGGVEMSATIMHHYSWVRKDVHKKINNSTASKNLKRSSVVEDYQNAAEGYFCKYYQKTLEKVPNYFNIPEL